MAPAAVVVVVVVDLVVVVEALVVAVVVDLVVVVDEALVVVVEVFVVVVEEEEEVVPVKVEPMSPNLMLEYMTEADVSWLSTLEGTPELVAQVPRAIPGTDASAVVG